MCVRLLFIAFIALILNGCMTITPTEKSLLSNQTPIPSSDYNSTLSDIRALISDIDIEMIEVRQADGNRSVGIHIQQKDPQFVLLYFGPNNFPIKKHYKNILPLMQSLNADVYWFDYRGFGFTGGVADLSVLEADSRQIFNTIKSKTDKPFVVHGLSIGSIIAINLAANQHVPNLVIEGSITNVRDWIDAVFVNEAKYSYGIPSFIGYALKPFFRFEPSPELAAINNIERLKKHKGTLLMLSAEQDWETPPALNKRLYNAVKHNKKELHIIKDVGHLNLMTSDKVKSLYLQFLQNN